MEFIISSWRKFGSFLCVGLLAVALNPAYVLAMAGYSNWAGSEFGKIRLLAGEENASGMRYAGLEFKLADGWKTYWRSPGDSGVPPEFDWSASKNVKSVKVQWPTPRRFKDDFGNNIG